MIDQGLCLPFSRSLFSRSCPTDVSRGHYRIEPKLHPDVGDGFRHGALLFLPSGFEQVELAGVGAWAVDGKADRFDGDTSLIEVTEQPGWRWW